MTVSRTEITASGSPFCSCSKWATSAPAHLRHERIETLRFHHFAYEDLVKRDKANLDIFWLRDDSLGDSSDLPDPAILAAEILEDLQAALNQLPRSPPISQPRSGAKRSDETRVTQASGLLPIAKTKSPI